MKRITHIITGLGIGGAERALHTMLTGGLQAHFRNHVISLTDQGNYGPHLCQAGIDVACIGMAPGRATPSGLWRLNRIIKEQAPDIIQGWMYHGNVAASLARPISAPKAILSWNIRISLENGEDMKSSTKAVVKLGRWLSSGPDAIIYNSMRSRVQHETSGYSNTSGTFIPNGFDTTRWRPDSMARDRIRNMLGLSQDARIIGFVARSHPQKDLPNLFDAIAKSTQQSARAHFVCVGRGLAEAAPASLNLSRTSFLGQREDVHQLMPGFDVLCLSSRAEGFPNVIGEAMSCAVPCVTTDVGDAAEIVAGTGWVVPRGNAVALAASLNQALALPADELKQRGKAARERIVDLYSLSAVLQQYVETYQCILDRKTDNVVLPRS